MLSLSMSRSVTAVSKLVFYTSTGAVESGTRFTTVALILIIIMLIIIKVFVFFKSGGVSCHPAVASQ